MITLKKIIPLTLLLWLFAPVVHAQTYSIDWYKISGGGGTSTNGGYTVTGTIGQHDAGGALTGGGYSVTGGFWSLVSVVQTAGMPLLTITHAGSTVIISWPDTMSCSLQQNNNLAAPSGWAACSDTVCTNSGIRSITLTAPAGNLFFRLCQ